MYDVEMRLKGHLLRRLKNIITKSLSQYIREYKYGSINLCDFGNYTVGSKYD